MTLLRVCVCVHVCVCVFPRSITMCEKHFLCIKQPQQCHFLKYLLLFVLRCHTCDSWKGAFLNVVRFSCVPRWLRNFVCPGLTRHWWSLCDTQLHVPSGWESDALSTEDQVCTSRRLSIHPSIRSSVCRVLVEDCCFFSASSSSSRPPPALITFLSKNFSPLPPPLSLLYPTLLSFASFILLSLLSQSS